MTHRGSPDRAFTVPAIARVEGEGALRVRVRRGVVTQAHLDIYEPPRFFEGFLRGRQHTEPPDITARICGICPVAYQMSACLAVEAACGVEVDPAIHALRRLLYCGEWIESHLLHVYLLHAPDFLGYDNVVELAAHMRARVEAGLSAKKAGNRIVEVVGGRPIHPVNVRVGGFYRAPRREDIAGLHDDVLRARDVAVQTVEWVAGFDFPELELDHELVAMRVDGSYPIYAGSGARLVSTGGLDIDPSAFEDHILEEQVAHSTALHARLADRDGCYLVGPLARFALNRQWLSPLAREAADRAGLGSECRNPFRSIVVRAVEALHACDEALNLIDAYEPPARAAVDVPARAGVGHGITEAPRGVLYHRYQLDAGGRIEQARIVPPTSQNQRAIEDDLRRFVSARLDLEPDALRAACEHAVRNYDPCISCATHFLRLEFDR